MDTYILDSNRNPIPEPDMIKWMEWFSNSDRRIAFTEFPPYPVSVSTVFLGIDHSFFSGPPILYETIIFWEGHEINQKQMRYSTQAQALIGHEVMVFEVKESLKELNHGP